MFVITIITIPLACLSFHWLTQDLHYLGDTNTPGFKMLKGYMVGSLRVTHYCWSDGQLILQLSREQWNGPVAKRQDFWVLVSSTKSYRPMTFLSWA